MLWLALENAGLRDAVLTAGVIWKQDCQLGCFRVQVTETAAQSGVSNKERYSLTKQTVRGWEE